MTNFILVMGINTFGYKKLKDVVVLEEMISIAKYSNFKNSGQNDPPGVLGYLHFQCKVNIENEDHNFWIVVCLTRNGKFYYDHSVRIQKRPRLSPGPNSQAT